MKAVIKVFTIIGMIVGFWYILPIIFGIRTLKRLNSDQPLTGGDGALTFIFVSIIAGIMIWASLGKQDKEEDF